MVSAGLKLPVMIIACPACGTKYVVPDDALGIGGRTVRCAKCKHSWFQEGPDPGLPPRPLESAAPVGEEGSATGAGPPQGEDGDTPPPPPPSDLEEQPAESGAPTAPPPSPAVIPVRKRSAPTFAEARQGDGGSTPLPDAAITPPPFYRASDQPATSRRRTTGLPREREDTSYDYQQGSRPRRNHLRLLTAAAATFAALAVLAIAAIQLYGLPSWFPGNSPLFAAEEADLTMDFPDGRNQTRALPTGDEFLAVSGTIANTGRETRSVPPILLVLRDERNRVVYSQEIAPPAPELAPGETREVNEAIADIPQSAVAAEFGWAPR